MNAPAQLRTERELLQEVQKALNTPSHRHLMGTDWHAEVSALLAGERKRPDLEAAARGCENEAKTVEGWSAYHLACENCAKAIRAIATGQDAQGDGVERKAVAWRWGWKELRGDEGWTYTETPPLYPRKQNIQPLYLAPPQQEWMPIEGAPKDGTLVDLWAGGHRWTNCRWGRFDEESSAPFGKPHWRGAEQAGAEPTHYRLPPLPPAGEKS